MATFGEIMQALMAERGLSCRKLAAKVHCDNGYLSRIARDLKTPSRQLARAIDAALDAGGELTALCPERNGRKAAPKGWEEDEEEMERRTLLQALMALGATSSPIFEALQDIRISVDRVIERGEVGHVDDWNEIVAEYGHSYVLLPSQRLLGDLASDMVIVQQITARKKRENSQKNRDERVLAPWCRITAGLAVLIAKTLSNLGQPREAREWWGTAQSAADASGDTDLSLWIAGERLVHGLYERRPPVILIDKANKILARTSNTPSRGLLHVRAVHAQLLALERPAAEATAELQVCGELFGRLPASITSDVHSIAGWAEDRLRYTEAWVYAHLGKRGQLDDTVERALQILPAADPRVHSQLCLLQAFGHIRAGDATEGVRRAHDVYSNQPVEHRTIMVASLADQVLEAVPARQIDERIVTDYRELLADSEGKAIT